MSIAGVIKNKSQTSQLEAIKILSIFYLNNSLNYFNYSNLLI